jgi:hypothetical protein
MFYRIILANNIPVTIIDRETDKCRASTQPVTYIYILDFKMKVSIGLLWVDFAFSWPYHVMFNPLIKMLCLFNVYAHKQSHILEYKARYSMIPRQCEEQFENT